MTIETYNAPLAVTFYHGRNAIGEVTIVKHAEYVVGLALDKVAPEELLKVSASQFDKSLQTDIDDIFGGKDVKMLVKGTELQVKVWRELLKVQQPITYKDLARRVGHPLAWRAVANAVGANPISVLIPCHKIIRSNGGLGGYRWGTHKKKELLHSSY
jgi:O-6-methylguanine DNA methyltransferase